MKINKANIDEILNGFLDNTLKDEIFNLQEQFTKKAIEQENKVIAFTLSEYPYAVIGHYIQIGGNYECGFMVKGFNNIETAAIFRYLITQSTGQEAMILKRDDEKIKKFYSSNKVEKL